ncbi:acyl-CoA N-acyltransferase [Piromyces finnis]|uniref:Acyl-CoA N-acyltransferase n=1 Tax=Piromyces finnis TaxID=1754191 RepID=A0A1Y1VJH9_9FUNG|nr:acyl-CoA N-acyltransferase [Piromyces finnis]|eukprot:ORX57863.1 acyl-CoA N-acyltransferase [Piromyces finnis]
MLLKNLKRKKEDKEEKIESNSGNVDINNNGICSVKEVSLLSDKSNTSQENNALIKKKITPVLQQVTKNNIDDLRKVYVSTFPLSYNSDFYNDILNEYPKALSRVATYHNIVVGGICCRLEKKTLKDIRQDMPTVSSDLSFSQQINNLKLLNTYTCYIMAISVLDLYQDSSIGSRLMSYIINYCENDKSISSINLHVHVKNEKAIRFYKKFGFYQKEYIRNYYFDNPNIIPPDVYYFQKDLNY